MSAVNVSGESTNSSQVNATPLPPVPPAPAGLTATPGDSQVGLSWNASLGATSYNVKRATVNGGPYNTIASPMTTNYTDTTAVNGTNYYYVVSAVNMGGESSGSAQVAAMPCSTAPVSLSMSLSGGALNLAWPSDHLGWILQSQTNLLGSGVSTNWVDVAGSDVVTFTSLPVSGAIPSVFYRLRHP